MGQRVKGGKARIDSAQASSAEVLDLREEPITDAAQQSISQNIILFFHFQTIG